MTITGEILNLKSYLDYIPSDYLKIEDWISLTGHLSHSQKFILVQL
jgi:hypothetical protein